MSSLNKDLWHLKESAVTYKCLGIDFTYPCVILQSPMEQGNGSQPSIDQAARLQSLEHANRIQAMDHNQRVPPVSIMDQNSGIPPPVTVAASHAAPPPPASQPPISSHMEQSANNRVSAIEQGKLNLGPVSTKSSKPLRSTNNKMKYCCDFCMYRTDRKDLYTRHQYIHTDDKPFICYACGKLFNRADHVKKHFFRIHADQLYDPLLTRRHHERPQSYSHQPSTLSLPTMVSLPRCVPKEEPCQGRAKPSKTYECLYCTWKGVDSWCLRRHLNTHIKPYVCTLCDYKGARPDRLIKHTLRIHRKHICLRCGVRFDTQEEKEAHQSPCRLTDESRKCAKCQSVFGTKGDLNTHCIVAHGMQLMSCRDCDFKTALIGDFEAHCRQYHASAVINPHDVSTYMMQPYRRM